MHKLKVFALATLLPAVAAFAQAATASDSAPASVAVGPQYDSTHVYVAPDQVELLAASFIAVFGGGSSKPVVVNVTPTSSSTISEVVFTPAGFLSVFGFKTPIPYPFGEERTGYLVSDMDAAIASARHAGAEIVVSPFADPIGRDVVIRWPGGVNMQIYWHNTPPSYAPLATVPENRVYVSRDQIDAFIHDFTTFSGGRVVADDPTAPGVEIGRPGDSYRRVRLESTFGKITALVTDGHLPWPYGRELTGYEVGNLAATLAKAKAAGVDLLAGPYSSEDRDAAIVRFPGGYIAEVHARRPR
ncbi:glyoxalase [Methylocapsa sp. S129]|uniref:glyoxalase n=1 Tax=Methylocapsa sp. S129 TaxID=1641869 RepID=UPI00131BF0DE|nr:glyoxalase [Methylocapsa sp. S129]